MKHKLQNLLKHKFQWLLLLAVLLGVSQGVWGTDYYITGAVGTGGWGTWKKMTQSETNIYYYECTSLGDFKFSNNSDYNENFYKQFTHTGTVTGVTLNNNCSSNGNCSLSNFQSGYNYPVRVYINVSTYYIWATATKIPDKYYLRGDIPGVGWNNNNEMTNSSGTYTYSVNISTTGNYSFKLYKSTSQWLGKDGTTISGTSTINDFYFADSGDKGNNITLKADVAGSYNFSFNVSEKTLTVTFPSSCTTVTSTSAGGSATLTLSNGATEAITSNTTYNGSRTPEGSGDTYLWTVSPSPFTGATTIGTSTATSTTIRFRREGQYAVKFAAGCGSASVESSAFTVNVYPGSLYVAGPLFKGSGIWNQTETMSKSGSGTSAVYTKDLTVAYAGGEFTFQSVTSAGASNYILPHYCTTSGGSSYTNITRSGSGNNNLTSSFTLANGDNVQLKVAYRGANASGEPKYDFSLCRYPTASGFTMNRTSATYTGSNLTVTVSPKDGYGAVSNIKYAGTTNAGATYSKSSTGPTEAGTYTVYADIAATGTWCAKEQLEIGT
ncbi:MAG: hypothetical protein IJP50_07835, partial [Paludibacteraceae bacterium]|nr:hypothetical protein [Paludibacteraceae bacterium]